MSLTASATATATAAPSRRSRLARLTAGAALAAALVGGAGAGAAQAAQYTAQTLAPGQSACVSQYASYQVRGLGTATADGARFKVLRNGVVIQATAGRVASWSTELRSQYGNFPGPAYYSVCAYNTGTRSTTVSLSLLTDAEF